ncbi:MAG: discoidin domain-containing protein, partial [Bryobacteraceae bacterium]
PGWFWHENENARVKTPAQLIDLYYKSAGRGASLLLNSPPNRDGLLPAEDIAALRAFGDYRRATFSRNLAAGAKVTASNVRGNARAYAGANLVDARADSFWATDDAVLAPQAAVDFGRPITFSVIRLREEIRLGQRIDSVAVDRWNAGAWEPLATATSIGAQRLIRLDKPVETSRLRLRVTQASASPALSEFAVFAEPGDALR